MKKDDDVINISDLQGDALRDHLRHLSDLTSCPCNTCQRICNKWDHVVNCDAYQLWLENKWRERELCMEAKEHRRKHTGGGRGESK